MSYIGTTPAPQMTEVGTGSVETQDIQDGAVTAAKLAAGAAVPAQTGQSGKFLTTNGTTASWATVQTGVTITSVSYSGDDLAVDPTTPLQCTLTGTGFVAGTVIYIDTVSATNSATAITVVSSTSITFTPPAGKAANNYNVWAVLPTGVMAVLVNGILYSGTPNWSSQSTSLAADSQALSIQLAATGDTPLVYSIVSGTLPPGTTLSSTGLISGTVTVEAVYPNIIIRATDPQNQDASVTIQITISLSDQFFKNTTLLLSGNGTNGAQNNTFLDASTNNFTLTRGGNATQGTFTPYGDRWSNYFDGTGDYLSTPGNTAFDFGSGNFTIEAWVYRTTSGAFSVISDVQYWYAFSLRVNSSGAAYSYGFNSSTSSQNWYCISANNVVPVNAWCHLALVRNGSSVTVYANGVNVASTTFSGASAGTTSSVRITHNDAGVEGTGYVSNVRIVKGTAVYTNSFTPSTAPLAAITGTSLLTCQANRLIDTSTNNFAITKNGDITVQRFSPFAPAADYSPSVIGGSGYFDGSGDYVTIPSSSSFTFTGDYTWEAWIYPTAASPSGEIISKHLSGTTGWYMLTVETNLKVSFVIWNDQNASSNAISTNTLNANAWNHIAGGRNGSNVFVCVNGVYASTPLTVTPRNSDTSINIGANANGSTNFFAGYISNVRAVAAAVYTANYTVPTAPLTAIANTRLLLSFTNAGIFDSTMLSDLETVGNAQVSTTVKKYGTGSIYFDATGDYLIPPASPNYAFGTGDFTIETWMYTNTLSGGRGFFQSSDTAGGLKTSYTSGIILTLSDGSTGAINANILNTNIGSAAGSIATGTWYHVAVTRQSGSVRLFLNGTLVAGPTTIAGDIFGQNICIGGYYNASYLWNGYLDDFRITKGVARYTANFTAPTAEFKGR